jgi:hypothetical protein
MLQNSYRAWKLSEHSYIGHDLASRKLRLISPHKSAYVRRFRSDNAQTGSLGGQGSSADLTFPIADHAGAIVRTSGGNDRLMPPRLDSKLPNYQCPVCRLSKFGSTSGKADSIFRACFSAVEKRSLADKSQLSFRRRLKNSTNPAMSGRS